MTSPDEPLSTWNGEERRDPNRCMAHMATTQALDSIKKSVESHVEDYNSVCADIKKQSEEQIRVRTTLVVASWILGLMLGLLVTVSVASFLYVIDFKDENFRIQREEAKFVRDRFDQVRQAQAEEFQKIRMLHTSEIKAVLDKQEKILEEQRKRDDVQNRRLELLERIIIRIEAANGPSDNLNHNSGTSDR